MSVRNPGQPEIKCHWQQLKRWCYQHDEQALDFLELLAYYEALTL